MGGQPDDIIELEPHVEADGTIIYATTEPTQDLVLADGKLVVDENGAQVHSALPQERLAGTPDPWEVLLDTMARHEAGGATGQEIVLRPGGKVEIQQKGQLGQVGPRSQLPQERLAATKPWITASDVAEIRRLDRDNVENWTPTYTDALDGWKFTLQPRTGGTQFTFLTFRSPQDAGMWRIWLMSPNLDTERGHVPHVITVQIGGKTIPVLCSKPGSAPCTSLTEVRATSSKWAVYTEARLMGRDPRFSK